MTPCPGLCCSLALGLLAALADPPDDTVARRGYFERALKESAGMGPAAVREMFRGEVALAQYRAGFERDAFAVVEGIPEGPRRQLALKAIVFEQVRQGRSPEAVGAFTGLGDTEHAAEVRHARLLAARGTIETMTPGGPRDLAMREYILAQARAGRTSLGGLVESIGGIKQRQYTRIALLEYYTEKPPAAGRALQAVEELNAVLMLFNRLHEEYAKITAAEERIEVKVRTAAAMTKAGRHFAEDAGPKAFAEAASLIGALPEAADRAEWLAHLAEAQAEVGAVDGKVGALATVNDIPADLKDDFGVLARDKGLRNIVRHLANQGRFERAAEVLTRIQGDALKAQALAFVAEARAAKDAPAARREVAQALKLAGDGPSPPQMLALANCARALLKLGDRDGARAAAGRIPTGMRDELLREVVAAEADDPAAALKTVALMRPGTHRDAALRLVAAARAYAGDPQAQARAWAEALPPPSERAHAFLGLAEGPAARR
jgi:hypothetical protein